MIMAQFHSFAYDNPFIEEIILFLLYSLYSFAMN